MVTSTENSVSYRPIIVWAMNDKLEKEELQRQLTSFKESGYGGVMVMPWGGLPNDFMDDEWLDAVHYILLISKKLSLNIWIWDDWLFGSGPAGGELTQNFEYRAKTLKVVVDYIIEPGESADFITPQRAISGGTFSVNKFGNPTGNSFDTIELDHGRRVTITAKSRTRLVIVSWHYASGMQHTTKSHITFLDPNISEEECDIRISDDSEVWSVDMMNSEAIRQYTQLIHQRYFDAMPEFFGNTLRGFFYEEPKVATSTPWTLDFPEHFKRIKGYDLTPYLPLMLTDVVMESVNFNKRLKSDRIKQITADYQDVWTSLVADSFYKTIQDWCQRHNVISTGHPIGDNSLDELLSNGGLYFKNMDYSHIPGIDTVGGFNTLTPGQFMDSPRFAGSRAVFQGRSRAMSESFAVYGHGMDLDHMRYVCEHQIIRGVNTFFCKLSNYNREKSLHFHPPELSDFNPVIKHFGTNFCDRIENVAKLMSVEASLPRVALYVGVFSYYHNDSEIAERITNIAEKLTYNQIEFDYIWDRDIEHLEKIDNLLLIPSGQAYYAIVIPSESMMPTDIRRTLEAFGTDALVCDLQKQCLETVVATCKSRIHTWFSIVSHDVRISMRKARGTDGTQYHMFLSEAQEKEILIIEPKAEISVFELNLSTWKLELLQNVASRDVLRLKFAPGESRILLFDASGTVQAPLKKEYGISEKATIQNWTLTIPDGQTVGHYTTLPDWSELGFSGYTGFMRYTTQFEWESNESEVMLSLGKVCYAAILYLDGKKVGDCVFTPFQLKLENLTRGKHKLEIDVLNTMANMIFGDEDRLQELRAAGAFKGTYAPFYRQADMAKLTSGLLGPVELKSRTG